MVVNDICIYCLIVCFNEKINSLFINIDGHLIYTTNSQAQCECVAESDFLDAKYDAHIRVTAQWIIKSNSRKLLYSHKLTLALYPATCCHSLLTHSLSSDWSAKDKHHLAQELSDVLIYLVRLAEKCHIDLPKETVAKIALNSKKYPADIVHGSSKKYTEYKINGATGS